MIPTLLGHRPGLADLGRASIAPSVVPPILVALDLARIVRAATLAALDLAADAPRAARAGAGQVRDGATMRVPIPVALDLAQTVRVPTRGVPDRVRIVRAVTLAALDLAADAPRAVRAGAGQVRDGAITQASTPVAPDLVLTVGVPTPAAPDRVRIVTRTGRDLAGDDRSPARGVAGRAHIARAVIALTVAIAPDLPVAARLLTRVS